MRLLEIARRLAREVGSINFAPPVAYVYNPLEYAERPYAEYLRRYARRGVEVVLLGMNPGPFGMVQTGVPFGDPSLVRDWLGIEAPVGKPPKEHPKRPVLGFSSTRGEVSGQRLWGWARETFGTPENFFERFFVLNYCPLALVEASGRNRTPDKCRPEERKRLFRLCDDALRESILWLRPRFVVGIGAFAEERARSALEGLSVQIGRILHPSPQSPAANRGWAEAAARELRRLGIDLPSRAEAGAARRSRRSKGGGRS